MLKVCSSFDLFWRKRGDNNDAGPPVSSDFSLSEDIVRPGRNPCCDDCTIAGGTRVAGRSSASSSNTTSELSEELKSEWVVRKLLWV